MGVWNATGVPPDFRLHARLPCAEDCAVACYSPAEGSLVITSKHKMAAGIIAGLIVLTGGIALWINHAASKKFARMERQVQALHDEIRKRETSRPPRPGPPLPGNAWEDYDQALAAVKADGPALECLNLFIERDAKADVDVVRQRIKAHASTLDLFRSGVRREKSDHALKWEQGSNLQLPSYRDTQRLGTLVAAQARLLAQEDRPRQAADLLLDGCQFARDLGSNAVLITQMISMALYGEELQELRDLIQTGHLGREDLLEVETGLGAADRGFPKHGETMRNESLFLGYALLEASGNPDYGVLSGGPVEALSLWRYAFSARLTLASAYDQIRSLLESAAGSDDLTWAEVRKLLGELEQEAKKSRNPVVRIALPGILRNERLFRERRAQLRLLRAAAGWRATGTCPELEDPFGTKLLHDEKDGLLRVWSVGSDGTDHHGTGDWKPDAGKDILLEWKR